MSCLFFGLSGTSAEGFETTLIPRGGIDNMMSTDPSDMGSEIVRDPSVG